MSMQEEEDVNYKVSVIVAGLEEAEQLLDQLRWQWDARSEATALWGALEVENDFTGEVIRHISGPGMDR